MTYGRLMGEVNVTTIRYRVIKDFSHTKVGDTIVVQYGSGTMAHIGTVKVSRVTKKQLICVNKYEREERYRIDGGLQVGAEGGKWGWLNHDYAIGIKIEDGVA